MHMGRRLTVFWGEGELGSSVMLFTCSCSCCCSSQSVLPTQCPTGDLVDDNLLTKEGGLNHRGEKVTFDEDLSPSLENLIVFLWLGRIHIKLPSVVKQKYGAELETKL